mgnify:CR=1 FL=1
MVYQTLVNITDEELAIKRPKREVLDKRFMMAFLARREGMSVAVLAAKMNCHRTTIHYYVRQAIALLETNKEFQTKYSHICHL